MARGQGCQGRGRAGGAVQSLGHVRRALQQQLLGNKSRARPGRGRARAPTHPPIHPGGPGPRGAPLPGCCWGLRTAPRPGRPPASAAPPGEQGRAWVAAGPPEGQARARDPEPTPHPHRAQPPSDYLGEPLGVSWVPGDDFLQSLEPIVDGGLIQGWGDKTGGICRTPFPSMEPAQPLGAPRGLPPLALCAHPSTQQISLS